MPIVRDSSLRPEVGTRSAYRRFTGYLMPSWLTHLSRRSPPTTVTSARRGCLLMGSARTSSVLVRSKRDRRVAFGAVDHAAIAGSIAKAKIFMLDMLLFLCNFQNRRCGLFTTQQIASKKVSAHVRVAWRRRCEFITYKLTISHILI